MATKRTRILLGCYRKGECGDAEVYVPAVAAVLSRYQAEVAKAVTDPVSGLPSWQDWLPTVAEVRRACEREAAKHYAALQPPPLRLPEPERSREEIQRVHSRWLEVRSEIIGACLVKPDESPKGERLTGRIDPRKAERDEAVRRLEGFKCQPLPPLSEAAKASLGLGAYDRAPIPEAAE